MLLVIDAGNTNIVFAVRDDTGWIGSWRIRTDPQRTSDEYAVWLLALLGHVGLRKEDVSRAVLGTVVPAALYHLRKLCREWFAVEPLVARAAVRRGHDADRTDRAGADPRRALHAGRAQSRAGHAQGTDPADRNRVTG